jgi:hypothetical protein
VFSGSCMCVVIPVCVVVVPVCVLFVPVGTAAGPRVLGVVTGDVLVLT